MIVSLVPSTLWQGCALGHKPPAPSVAQLYSACSVSPSGSLSEAWLDASQLLKILRKGGEGVRHVLLDGQGVLSRDHRIYQHEMKSDASIDSHFQVSESWPFYVFISYPSSEMAKLTRETDALRFSDLQTTISAPYNSYTKIEILTDLGYVCRESTVFPTSQVL